MTQYTLRATIAAPAAMLEDANALALCLGESPSDINTFARATHTDADGNEYAVASTVAKPVFIEMAAIPLVAPPYYQGVDLDAAGRAQAVLAIGEQASPDVMACILGDRLESAQDHIEALGLTRIVIDDIA